jgi:hypothetical protein
MAPCLFKLLQREDGFYQLCKYFRWQPEAETTHIQLGTGNQVLTISPGALVNH